TIDGEIAALEAQIATVTAEQTQKASDYVALQKLQEQQQELDNSVTDAMKAELNTKELFDKANEIGTLKVREIFSPLVTAVAEDFIVKVVQ
ncbi:MAG: hypothetical protein RR284_06705, partial [Ruthenibacterium sp.]